MEDIVDPELYRVSRELFDELKIETPNAQKILTYLRNIPSALPVVGNYFSSFLNDVDHETQQVILTNILFLQLEINEEIRNLATDFKRVLEQKSGIPLESHISFTPLPTRKEYNDTVIEAIESAPKSLLAIIVGPLFLHPMSIIERRLEREPRKSFSLALRNYLRDSLYKDDRDICLIIRNSKRYPQIIKDLVEKYEVDDLIEEMKFALHQIFSPQRSHSTISFCCMDPGLFQVIITEKFCFEPNRNTDLSPIDSGNRFEGPTYIRMRKT